MNNVRYSPHYGQQNVRNSDALKPKTKYTCRHPSGNGTVTKVIAGKPFKLPIALWLKEAAGWRLCTVVDKAALPEWAVNYEQYHAEKT